MLTPRNFASVKVSCYTVHSSTTHDVCKLVHFCGHIIVHTISVHLSIVGLVLIVRIICFMLAKAKNDLLRIHTW